MEFDPIGRVAIFVSQARIVRCQELVDEDRRFQWRAVYGVQGQLRQFHQIAAAVGYSAHRDALDRRAELDVVDETNEVSARIALQKPHVVAADSIQSEVLRVDAAGSVEVAFVKHQIVVGRQNGAVGNAELLIVPARIAQIPAANVDVRRRRIVQLDCVCVGQRRCGEELIDDNVRRWHCGIRTG